MVLGGAEVGRGIDAPDGIPGDDGAGREEIDVSFRDVAEGSNLRGDGAAFFSTLSMDERRLTGWTYNDGTF